MCYPPLRATVPDERRRTTPEEEEGDPTALGQQGSSCDYGFRNASLGGTYTERGGPTTPSNVLVLSLRNFKRELDAIFGAIADANEDAEMRESGWMEAQSMGGTDMLGSVQDEDVCRDLRASLEYLTLDADAIWQRELKREAESVREKEKGAPLIIKLPYIALCWILDRVFTSKQPIQRFWFLETVARMPYFSYISMLHLYETLGWWRRAAVVKRVHFAEEWNEFHHLLIMESLGGDSEWRSRFMANHAAILYYWILNAVWLISPMLAYRFSELIENHAVDTYSQFVDENESVLRSLPAPAIAKQYYQSDDLYMFDEFQTSRIDETLRRRPVVETLYDVFRCVRDDELEHVKTMVACQVRRTAPRPRALTFGLTLPTKPLTCESLIPPFPCARPGG